VSALREFTTGGFVELLDDAAARPAEVTRVVFCSGKIYYDLLAAREERQAAHVALVRVEQLYPFAAEQAAEILDRYAATAEVVWAQEEPRNMGAWRVMRECVQPLLGATGREVRYVGRPEAASPATGSAKRHRHEAAEIVGEALG
jgi:2-oxoglutarate dehydrogenase E1 component